MTISPQPPLLIPVEGKDGIKEFKEDHLTFIKVGFGYSLKVFIKAGYRTDGASIPTWLQDDEIRKFIKTKYPKIQTRSDLEDLIKFLVGTPWDMPRLLASVVHDVLYGRKWKFRWLCDKVYRWTLEQVCYDKVRTEIEYAGVRLVGWRNWDMVTDWEKTQTKRLSDVRFIRTRDIDSEIAMLARKTP